MARYLQSFQMDGSHIDDKMSKRLILNPSQLMYAMADDDMGIGIVEVDIEYDTQITLANIKRALGVGGNTSEEKVIDSLYNLQDYNEYRTEDGDPNVDKFVQTVTGETVERRRVPHQLFG